jgi:hypothetical protein
MKKFLFTAALAATAFFVQSGTTVNETATHATAASNRNIERLDLQDNMVTSPQPLSQQEMAAKKLVYLGLYDVYLNGKYIGRYHVYQIVN